MQIISHISSEISEWEAELFIKAVSTKGLEATGIVWLTWWFDYKNDPKNTIRDDLKSRMIEVAEQHSGRLAKWSRKLTKI